MNRMAVKRGVGFQFTVRQEEERCKVFKAAIELEIGMTGKAREIFDIEVVSVKNKVSIKRRISCRSVFGLHPDIFQLRISRKCCLSGIGIGFQFVNPSAEFCIE